ncbi:hypothetical protein KIPB_011578, partial [Kipferlia bialata]|eukprot:g11578.t1
MNVTVRDSVFRSTDGTYYKTPDHTELMLFPGVVSHIVLVCTATGTRTLVAGWLTNTLSRAEVSRTGDIFVYMK